MKSSLGQFGHGYSHVSLCGWMVCAGQPHCIRRDGRTAAGLGERRTVRHAGIAWQRCFNWRVMGDVLLVVDCGSAVTRAVLAWPDGRLASVGLGAETALPSGVYVAADGVLITGTAGQQRAGDDPARYVADPIRSLGRPS